MDSFPPDIQLPNGALHYRGRVPTEITMNINVDPKTTAWKKWQNCLLPYIDSANQNSQEPVARKIAARLRSNEVRHPINDNGENDFWPPKLFNHLFDKDAIYQIVKELVEEGKLPTDEDHSRLDANAKATHRWVNTICGLVPNSPKFICVLAILVLIEEEGRIKLLIDAGLRDDCLPLRRRDDREYYFKMWKPSIIDSFFLNQRKFTVQVLKPKQMGKYLNADHFKFAERDIKPWTETLNTLHKSSTSQKRSWSRSLAHASNYSVREGGYGAVYQVIVHPWQHHFQETLRSVSANPDLFALKTLRSTNMEEFVKESEQLRRFGGRHPNIVTLLASIDDGSRSLSLLFPWAEGDLLHFWTRRVKPSHDLQIFTWTANQFYRIVEAINFIHDPPGEVDSLGKSLFGRHGDIKPENILWYTRGIEDTLVISDLGLTAVHRETSRSMVDAMNISTTLSYRPPECDIASIVKGKIGFISRSFDIWGLGCVFLEHMVWTLRGCEGMTAFDENRCSPYLDGLYTETNEYFGVVRVAAETSPQHYAFKIKDQVVECFASLHMEPNCTQYIHDFLDLIEERMLVVESDQPPVLRIRANELLIEMGKLKNNCCNREYCLVPCPRNTNHKPRDPVMAPLNSHALRRIGIVASKLTMYSGTIRSANPRKAAIY